MFNFAVKNLLTRKSKTILSAISIIMATTIGLLAFNISSQVNDGIVNTVGYYDMLIGPSGSESQLVLNTMFFTGTPVGTIDFENYEKLKADSRVNAVIPFAMGDSYSGYKIVGTTAEFLKDLKLGDGKLFNENFEAVIGSGVANGTGLKVGSEFLSSHGVSEGGHVHENNPYTVAGVLKKTGTAYDNVVFVNVSDVWEAHASHDEHETEHEEEHEDEHEDEHVEEHEEGEEHEHEHEEGGLTAILVKTKSPMIQSQLSSEINAISGLQAINPATVAREIMNNVDLSKQIIYVLCFIIGIMTLLIIYIMALLNMHDSKKDIKLMRLIGISKGKINLILIIQNFIITLTAIVVSILLCRGLLLSVNVFTSSMGIVVDYMKFYIGELYIVIGVILFSFLPVFVANVKSFRNDPIQD